MLPIHLPPRRAGSERSHGPEPEPSDAPTALPESESANRLELVRVASSMNIIFPG